MNYGDQLIELCRSSQDGLLLVAPFIKVKVLAQLLDVVNADLPVDVVTRWWPWEIAHGVSDLEVWEFFRGRETVRHLFLRQDVHAKYYRAGNRCQVGSANLTQKALGQVDQANLELMVELPSDSPDLVKFEEELWRAAVIVDEEIYLRMSELVEHLTTTAPDALDHVAAPRSSPGDGQGVDLATWVPRTRQPEDLFLAYAGRADELSQASAAASVADLAILNLPAGLDPETFRRAVRTMLLQTPVIAALDRFLGIERRFGEVSQHVARLTGSDRDVGGRDWQVILRWFRFFATDRYDYRRPRYSELIVRSPQN